MAETRKYSECDSFRAEDDKPHKTRVPHQSEAMDIDPPQQPSSQPSTRSRAHEITTVSGLVALSVPVHHGACSTENRRPESSSQDQLSASGALLSSIQDRSMGGTSASSLGAYSQRRNFQQRHASAQRRKPLNASGQGRPPQVMTQSLPQRHPNLFPAQRIR